jgi:hypothetical protein
MRPAGERRSRGSIGCVTASASKKIGVEDPTDGFDVGSRRRRVAYVADAGVVDQYVETAERPVNALSRPRSASMGDSGQF